MRDRTLTARQRCLFSLIAGHVGGAPAASFAIYDRTLAYELACSEVTLRRDIKVLVTRGLIWKRKSGHSAPLYGLVGASTKPPTRREKAKLGAAKPVGNDRFGNDPGDTKPAQNDRFGNDLAKPIITKPITQSNFSGPATSGITNHDKALRDSGSDARRTVSKKEYKPYLLTSETGNEDELTPEQAAIHALLGDIVDVRERRACAVDLAARGKRAADVQRILDESARQRDRGKYPGEDVWRWDTRGRWSEPRLRLFDVAIKKWGGVPPTPDELKAIRARELAVHSESCAQRIAQIGVARWFEASGGSQFEDVDGHHFDVRCGEEACSRAKAIRAERVGKGLRAYDSSRPYDPHVPPPKPPREISRGAQRRRDHANGKCASLVCACSRIMDGMNLEGACFPLNPYLFETGDRDEEATGEVVPVARLFSVTDLIAKSAPRYEYRDATHGKPASTREFLG